MNYYSPNYYGGYSSGTQYQQQMQPPMPQQVQSQMQPTFQLPQSLGLNGKIVDGEEMVSVENISTQDILVRNANLIVERVA